MSQLFREEIGKFKPEELIAYEKSTVELSQEDESIKADLLKEYNVEINNNTLSPKRISYLTN